MSENGLARDGLVEPETGPMAGEPPGSGVGNRRNRPDSVVSAGVRPRMRSRVAQTGVGPTDATPNSEVPRRSTAIRMALAEHAIRTVTAKIKNSVYEVYRAIRRSTNVSRGFGLGE